MKLRGKVKGGVVVLEAGASLPEGLEVLVEAAESTSGGLGERLMKYAGAARDLPEDMAMNHHRHVYGLSGE